MPSVLVSFNRLRDLLRNLARLRWLLLVALVMSLPQSVSADETSAESARNLINKMSRAVRELNYDGVFIYQRDGQMNSLRLIHRADENGEYERLVSLTGSAREVIRNNQSVTCIFPDDQTVVVEKSRPRELLSAQLPQSTEKLSAYYDFSVKGEDRVAGRLARIVSIKPKDAYRYGYQFWIDKGNNFLLKSELRSRTGMLLEQIMFTQVDILDTVADELLKPSIAGNGYTRYNNLDVDNKVKAISDKWRVTWMPEGFRRNDHEMHPMTDNKTPVNHLVYSDGLAMVSIFIEKLNNGAELTPGLSKMGGVNAFARVANGYQVTAVGEVPQATVQRMANSVSLNLP